MVKKKLYLELGFLSKQQETKFKCAFSLTQVECCTLGHHGNQELSVRAPEQKLQTCHHGNAVKIYVLHKPLQTHLAFFSRAQETSDGKEGSDKELNPCENFPVILNVLKHLFSHDWLNNATSFLS